MNGVTSNTVVNRAIQLYGDDQAPVKGQAPTFDNSAAGVAAAALYAGVVQTVGRKFGWDFSRNTVQLALTGNTPPPQWDFEYVYPTNGVEIRQLMPAAIADKNDPLPIRWTVGNDIVNNVATKVIFSNLANALATYSNQPPEALWDAGFTEAVVRLLASEMAMAIAGRPDTSQNLLTSGQMFEGELESRDG